MKRLFSAACFLSVIPATAQTVDEVIQRFAANLGGLEAFNKITTAKISGTFSAQGNDFPLTTQVVNGKAMRTDVSVMGQSVTNCYSNGKGWKVNPFAGVPNPTEVSGNELIDFKNQSMLSNALMDYRARGHQVELQGVDSVEGVKVFKIKLTSKEDGRVTLYFISQADYSLIKTDGTRSFQGKDTDMETFYSDPKEFGGVKFLMTRVTRVGGDVFQTIQFDRIELNVPIDEKIFDMPKQ